MFKTICDEIYEAYAHRIFLFCFIFFLIQDIYRIWHDGYTSTLFLTTIVDLVVVFTHPVFRLWFLSWIRK